MLNENIKQLNKTEVAELLSDRVKELYNLVNEINEQTDFNAILVGNAGIAENTENGGSVIGGGGMVGKPDHLATLLSNDDDFEKVAMLVLMSNASDFVSVNSEEDL